ncbi:MAG: GGDEF domain-containing protein, partial [Nakamurella sp.]
VLATMIVGWDSGFHFYLLLTVPVLAVSPIRPPRLRTLAVAAAGSGYIALDLFLRTTTPPHVLSPGTLKVLYYFNLLAALLILAGLAGRYHRIIQQTQGALHLMATTDPLTQLRNRQSLQAFIDEQHSRARRGHALSFIMCDVDHFKRVNDRGGHAAGDAALRAVGGSMAARVRVTDVVGRWGGEEFLVVLPDAEPADAAWVAERLRAGIASLPTHLGTELSRITVTAGVSTLGPGESASQAVARADAALYDGKRQGRNQVVIAAGPTHDDRVGFTVT